MFDTVIVGGGPAGLSAGLVLGRARRSVLIADQNQPRNAVSHASHSFFTQDGTPPADLRRIGREQLAPYDSVTFTPAEIVDVERVDARFVVTFAQGTPVEARTLLLATGVRDELPAIEGLTSFWGTSIFSCPFCDGWEVRDRPLGVIANGEMAAMYAPFIQNWSRDLILFTNGPATFDDAARELLSTRGIPIREEAIARFEGSNGQLARVRFQDGDGVDRHAIFTQSVAFPRTDLAVKLGCELFDFGIVNGLIKIDASGQTTVPGVYAAGDVVTPMPQIALVVASGATAAFSISHTLILGH